MAKEKDKIEHFAYLKMVDGQKKLMDKLISAVGESKANQMYDQIIEKLSDESDIKADEIDSFVTQLAENNNATKKLVSDVFVSIKMVEEAKKKVDKNYVDTQNAVNNAKNTIEQKKKQLQTASEEDKKQILKQISTSEKQLKQLKIEDFINANGVLTAVPDEVLSKYFKNGYLEFPKNINISNIQGLFGDGSKLRTDLVGVNNIPSNLRVIGKNIFNGCSNLRNFDVPVTVTTIEDGAFAHCSSLQTLNLPSTLINVGDMAFAGTTCQLTIDDNNERYKLVNGQFIDIQTKTLVAYDEMQSRDFVPDKNINIIGQAALMGVILNSITIKDSNIKVIEKEAFKDAIIDNNVVINVEEIKENAFENTKVGGDAEVSAETIKHNAFEKANFGGDLKLNANTIEENAVKDAVVNGDLKVETENMSQGALSGAIVKKNLSINATKIETGVVENTQCSKLNVVADEVADGAFRGVQTEVVTISADKAGSKVLEGVCANACLDIDEFKKDVLDGYKGERLLISKNMFEGLRGMLITEDHPEVSDDDVFAFLKQQCRDVRKVAIFREISEVILKKEKLLSAQKLVEEISQTTASSELKIAEEILKMQSEQLDEEKENLESDAIDTLYQLETYDYESEENDEPYTLSSEEFGQYAQTFDDSILQEKKESQEATNNQQDEVVAEIVITPVQNK